MKNFYFVIAPEVVSSFIVIDIYGIQYNFSFHSSIHKVQAARPARSLIYGTFSKLSRFLSFYRSTEKAVNGLLYPAFRPHTKKITPYRCRALCFVRVRHLVYEYLLHVDIT